MIQGIMYDLVNIQGLNPNNIKCKNNKLISNFFKIMSVLEKKYQNLEEFRAKVLSLALKLNIKFTPPSVLNICIRMCALVITTFLSVNNYN